MTVTPANGRDYATAKEAKASWLSGADWIINDLFHPYDGKPVNKAQVDEPVTLRFCKLTKVAVIV